MMKRITPIHCSSFSYCGHFYKTNYKTKNKLTPTIKTEKKYNNGIIHSLSRGKTASSPPPSHLSSLRNCPIRRRFTCQASADPVAPPESSALSPIPPFAGFDPHCRYSADEGAWPMLVSRAVVVDVVDASSGGLTEGSDSSMKV